MKWVLDLKMSVKLISSFVIIAIILAFVGFFGLSNMGNIDDRLTNMYDNNLIPIQDLSEAQNGYQRIRVNIRDMNLVAESKEDKAFYDERIGNFRTEIETLIDKYSNTVLTQAERDALVKFDPAWKEYGVLLDRAIAFGHAGDVAGYKNMAGEFRVVGDELQDVLDGLIALNVTVAERTNAEAHVVYETSRNIMIAVIIGALLLSIGFGAFISGIITRPLNRMVKLVAKVSDGDLRETTDIDTKDEVGQLARSINEMVLSWRTTAGGLLASAESVSAAAQQISASTEEIASGSTNQAHSAQTMSELFKELSAAINSVAQSAEQASEISNTTLGIAEDGGKVVRTSIEGMNRVNQQMSRLEEDSNRIGEIIEVIDDIAEQTNLLALNAAIEAARAGDQGRGFAVVADEVRKLAERSSEATKQITTIIKGMQENTRQSVKAVGEGVVSSQKTGEAFEHIVAMVNESANKAMEIAAASEEQAAQSCEVLASIESISAATEEAAASSEETAATAQALSQLAEQLNQSAAYFKMN